MNPKDPQAELLKALEMLSMTYYDDPGGEVPTVHEVLALFQTHQLELLTELLKHKTASYTVDGKYNKEFVVPVSVIEAKLKKDYIMGVDFGYNGKIGELNG